MKVFALEFYVYVFKVPLDRRISQICNLGLSCCFLCQKTGYLWSFFKHFFSRIHNIKITPLTKNLRPTLLQMAFMYMYVKFEVFSMNIN